MLECRLNETWNSALVTFSNWVARKLLDGVTPQRRRWHLHTQRALDCSLDLNGNHTVLKSRSKAKGAKSTSQGGNYELNYHTAKSSHIFALQIVWCINSKHLVSLLLTLCGVCRRFVLISLNFYPDRIQNWFVRNSNFSNSLSNGAKFLANWSSWSAIPSRRQNQ